MSTSDLSYEETGKLIALIEAHYYTTLTDETPEEFEKWKKHSTNFRIEKLGGYFKKTGGLGEEYLRKYLYAKFDKMSSDSPVKYHVTPRFKRALKDFFGKDVFPQLQGLTQVPKNEKVNIFKNSKWAYYYYDERKGIPGISTGFLTIDDDLKVKIKDRNHEKNTNLLYTGTVKPQADNSLLLFQMNTDQTGERDLHILVHIGNSGTKPQIAMGQYHNLDDNLTIISGTIILADTKKNFEGFTPTFFEKGTRTYRELNKQVTRYLGEKAGNRIRVPHNNLSYEMLGKWMRNKLQQRKNNVPDDFVKTFVSAPITSISTANFSNFVSQVQMIIESIEADCSCDCYCALTKLKKQSKRASNLLFQEIAEELRQCQLFVMILPPFHLECQTSALIEFGFIYARRIPVVIFNPVGEKMPPLPNLLEGAIKASNFVINYEYSHIDEVVVIIKEYGRKLFGLHKE